MAKKIEIIDRLVGEDYDPLVIAEIGINHNGDFNKAKKMIRDAHECGAECVKFQCHIIDDEMIKNDVIPGNTNEPIWKLVERCSFNEEQEIELKKLVESLGMIFLSTPFSRAAADRLERMGVSAYKIGSGECNNIPLIKHIASFGKPIILSTGMNDLTSVSESVSILEEASVDYALLHVTSIYPTPYEKVRLQALTELKKHFPNAVIGLSDHSIGNYTCFAAIAYGASMLLKDRLLDESDKTDILICEKCGVTGYHDARKRKFVCAQCGDTAPISSVSVAYAFKLLLQEILSLNIAPRLHLKERV